MALPLAVTDTSVLIYLHHLKLLSSLSLFFEQVLVPAHVRTEFLDQDDAASLEFALNLLPERGFFAPCDDYDTIQVKLYVSNGLHSGEAQALSQMDARSAAVLLIDERCGREVAIKERRTIEGTLKILARCHKHGLADYDESVARLKAETKFRATPAIIAEVRRHAMGAD